jgi:hypothetical protein
MRNAPAAGSPASAAAGLPPPSSAARTGPRAGSSPVRTAVSRPAAEASMTAMRKLVRRSTVTVLNRQINRDH